MINFVPKYIKDLGLGAVTYGNMAGFFMGGSALGNVIGGYFGDQYAKRKVAAIALLFAAFPIYIMSRIGWSALVIFAHSRWQGPVRALSIASWSSWRNG